MLICLGNSVRTQGSTSEKPMHKSVGTKHWSHWTSSIFTGFGEHSLYSPNFHLFPNLPCIDTNDDIISVVEDFRDCQEKHSTPVGSRHSRSWQKCLDLGEDMLKYDLQPPSSTQSIIVRFRTFQAPLTFHIKWTSLNQFDLSRYTSSNFYHSPLILYPSNDTIIFTTRTKLILFITDTFQASSEETSTKHNQVTHSYLFKVQSSVG